MISYLLFCLSLLLIFKSKDQYPDRDYSEMNFNLGSVMKFTLFTGGDFNEFF